MAVLYWLYDARCVCPWRHGYIGITVRLPGRLKQHAKRRRNFEWKILFEGTLHECRALEYRMRPKANVGWNDHIGGGKQNLGRGGWKHPPRSAESRALVSATLRGHVRTPESRAKQSSKTKGRPKSAEWKAKASAIAKARYAKPGERERMSTAVKKGKSTIHRRAQPDLFD